MIFVTVGTHEQPFNRLIEEVDRLKAEGLIEEEVFIQTGYSTYEPQYCNWKKLLSYDEMNRYIKEASIVITHGGPATFMGVVAEGKVPIVVPRLKQYGEHVNDHQLEFSLYVQRNYQNIVTVEQISQLKDCLTTHSQSTSKTVSNNKEFNNRFRMEIERLVNKL
ncbi:glycosyltransferase [Streptococcus himalayensis]|uniref:Multidrug MFS transporter n=1 Tax=Streptococcus himalayensis TaxID=1888195 RepID=A0A917EDE7_9STRE|nr:glycosyltransferase [Streptococcus himalayensis]GGE24890.1 multidrug MFS transporter [Streptococcus himalayensis]